METTDRPTFVLKDLARNPSSLPEARLNAAIELYLREGEQSFSEDMRPILSQVQEQILGVSDKHVLGPVSQLALLRHLNAKCEALRQSATDNHARLSETLDSKHAALAADLSATREIAERIAGKVGELGQNHEALRSSNEQLAEELAAKSNSLTERIEALETEPQRAQHERHDLASRLARLEGLWIVRLALLWSSRFER